MQMHPSDLWQLSQELEVVKWPQCNAVPNNSSLWALAQHLFTSCLLISVHYSSSPCSSKTVSVLCNSTDMTEDSPQLWHPVWFWASHWAPLGHSFPRVSWAIAASDGRSERQYLQNSKAHNTLVSDIIRCTPDTWLGQGHVIVLSCT